MLKRLSYISISVVYILSYYSFFFNADAVSIVWILLRVAQIFLKVTILLCYFETWCNIEKQVKLMLERIQSDWKMFENSDDAMEIFDKYLVDSYIFTFSACSKLLGNEIVNFLYVNRTVYINFDLRSSLLVFIPIAGIAFFITECRAIILDVIMPINESRPRKVEIDFESFVDKQQYFFLYLMQEALGVGIGFCSIITTASLFATIIKHSCATYKIARCVCVALFSLPFYLLFILSKLFSVI